MSDLFPDRLLSAIRSKGSPICVGIDPMLDSFPPALLEDHPGAANDPEAAIDAIYAFTTTVLRVVAPHVPIVKFQSAYFERYHWEGVEAYYSLIAEAKELGLLVIGDVKRGDIGSTSAAYAEGHLVDQSTDDEDVVTPDAITVNPMLGLDTLEPFTKVARQQGKGLFVLVRTSNPGSGDFQDVKLADGRTWSEQVADKLAPVAAEMVGPAGYSLVGAVVGATQPQTMVSLRRRLPQSIFLLPGYGAQGATAEMTRAAFQDGKGAIVSASRSILYAHKDKKHTGQSWEKAVEAATVDMKKDLATIL
jgi:orotidine-5'-phosphate decarboxylase